MVGEVEDGGNRQLSPFHCRNPTQVPHLLPTDTQPETAIVIPSHTERMLLPIWGAYNSQSPKRDQGFNLDIYSLIFYVKESVRSNLRQSLVPQQSIAPLPPSPSSEFPSKEQENGLFVMIVALRTPLDFVSQWSLYGQRVPELGPPVWQAYFGDFLGQK